MVSVQRRQSSDGNDCDYTGTLSADRNSVSGTYRCTKYPPADPTWRATISRQGGSGPSIQSIPLTRGCTGFVSGWSDGTSPSTIAAAVTPAAVVAAIWRYDRRLNTHQAWFPQAGAPGDLGAVNRNDALLVCATTTGTVMVRSGGTGSGQSIPQPPARFYGSVTLDGATAPNGTTIRARIGGTECGSGTSSGGSYVVDVASVSIRSGCGSEGATVSFLIASTSAQQTGTYYPGAPVALNLSATASQSCPDGSSVPSGQSCPPARSGRLELVGLLTLSILVPSITETVTARFTIRNTGGQPLILERLAAAGRRGEDWDSPNVTDFPHVTNLTLSPGQTYTYEQSRSFPESGRHFAEPAVQVNGTWNGILDAQSNPSRVRFVVITSVLPCPDGSSVPVGQQCPQPPRPCPDGTTVPVNQPCPLPRQQPPAAPSNLRAKALDSSRVRVEWDDNSDDEQEFRIYRMDGSRWIPIAILPADTQSHTDPGLAPATTYYYTVGAVNEGGETRAISSTEVTTDPQGGRVNVRGRATCGPLNNPTCGFVRLSAQGYDPIEADEIEPLGGYVFYNVLSNLQAVLTIGNRFQVGNEPGEWICRYDVYIDDSFIGEVFLGFHNMQIVDGETRCD